MAKIDRSILAANDQSMGDFGDPNKLESSISHLADKIDENDNGFSSHKDAAELAHPDKSVTERKMADSSVSSRTIQAGAVGTRELDPAILAQPTTSAGVQAKLQEHDDQLAENAKHTVVKKVNPSLLPVPFTSAVGDGVTDDTVALTNAIGLLTSKTTSVIDFSTRNGGVLELDEGFFLIDQIILKSNVTIKGQGIGKTILIPKYTNVERYLFDVSGTDTNNRLVNCEIKDLSIMPDASYQYAIQHDVTLRKQASIINFSYCSSVRLSNIIISGFAGVAINNVENYDSNWDNIQILGCGDATHNSVVFKNGTSDGCNAIHINGARIEGSANILFESSDGKFQREIQFGIGKIEGTGLTFKGTSSVNFVGTHFTWFDVVTPLLDFGTSLNTESYGIKFVGCSFLSTNDGYLSNNASDGYVTFNACSIKGFGKTFEGNKYDVSSSQLYSCIAPVFNIGAENKITANEFLATRGTDHIIKCGNDNIIAYNQNLYPVTTLGINVGTGTFNEIVGNKGFNEKVTGGADWSALNNYQPTNAVKVPHFGTDLAGCLKFDVYAKNLQIYDGTTWRTIPLS